MCGNKETPFLNHLVANNVGRNRSRTAANAISSFYPLYGLVFQFPANDPYRETITSSTTVVINFQATPPIVLILSDFPSIG